MLRPYQGGIESCPAPPAALYFASHCADPALANPDPRTYSDPRAHPRAHPHDNRPPTGRRDPYPSITPHHIIKHTDSHTATSQQGPAIATRGPLYCPRLGTTPHQSRIPAPTTALQICRLTRLHPSVQDVVVSMHAGRCCRCPVHVNLGIVALLDVSRIGSMSRCVLQTPVPAGRSGVVGMPLVSTWDRARYATAIGCRREGEAVIQEFHGLWFLPTLAAQVYNGSRTRSVQLILHRSPTTAVIGLRCQGFCENSSN